MKNYKIQIEDSEVPFFKQLMNKLDFVKYEEIPAVSEPRIYPAANFAIHANKNQLERKISNPSEQKSMHMAQEPKKVRKDAMTDIKDIMLKIEEMRNRPK